MHSAACITSRARRLTKANGNTRTLQQDEDALEVFDEWYDSPGTAVVANGERSTRSERLITWADTMTNTVAIQRSELRRTRMDLFQAEEEAREASSNQEMTAASLAEANEVRHAPT